MARSKPSAGLVRGTDTRVLDRYVDRLLIHALRSSQCKLMSIDAAGEHQEIMLPSGLGAAALKGTSCFLNLETTAPELRTLLRPSQIAAEAIDRVNAYVSPRNCGTPLHFDVRTVWIVQLYGCKTWMVGDTPAVHAPHRNCVAPQEASWIDYDGRKLPRPRDLNEAVLRPGDWLMVPQAVWHQTHTSVGSVSVTLAAPA